MASRKAPAPDADELEGDPVRDPAAEPGRLNSGNPTRPPPRVPDTGDAADDEASG